MLEVIDGSVYVLAQTYPSNNRLPGEVVEIKCDSGFFIFDSEVTYVYECMEGGAWNSTAEAICMRG